MNILQSRLSSRVLKVMALVTIVLSAEFTVLPAWGASVPENIPWTIQQSQAVPAPPIKDLTPEMTLNRWSIGDLRLSPDGNRVAMVVSEPAKASGQRRNIWIYDIAASSLRQFTAAAKSDPHPRWSPDGRTLGFLSDREGSNQVYLIPLDGGEARPLTEGKTGIDSFAWSPDGKRIGIKTTAPKTEDEEKKEKDKDDARIIGKPEERTLLQVLDVDTKALKTLVKGAWRIP